jgi:hypothetical protein
MSFFLMVLIIEYINFKLNYPTIHCAVNAIFTIPLFRTYICI